MKDSAVSERLGIQTESSFSKLCCSEPICFYIALKAVLSQAARATLDGVRRRSLVTH